MEVRPGKIEIYRRHFAVVICKCARPATRRKCTGGLLGGGRLIMKKMRFYESSSGSRVRGNFFNAVYMRLSLFFSLCIIFEIRVCVNRDLMKLGDAICLDESD